MAYRDDREALHARNAALEAEVVALRTQQALHAEQLEAAQRGEEGPELEVDRPKHGTVHPRAVAGLIGSSLAMFAVVMSARSFLRAPPSSAAAESEGTVVATWNATVTSSTDPTVAAVGSACAVESRLLLRGRPSTSAPRTTAAGVRTTVRCGGTPLYDPADPSTPPGASQHTFEASHHGAAEAPHPDDENQDQVFDIEVDERGVGARMLPSLSLDTKRGSALLHRAATATSPAFDVVLAVEPGSQPVAIAWSKR